MKAAICLLDLEIAGMRADIREAYRNNPVVLGIFPVAAYNGGPRNVAKLYRVLDRMKVRLDELSRPPEQPIDPFREMPLCLESRRHGNTSRGDPEVQQREPLVH